jgi:hypothetical protein
LADAVTPEFFATVARTGRCSRADLYYKLGFGMEVMKMKTGRFALLALCLIVGCVGSSVAQGIDKKEVAQKGKVPPEIFAKAKEKGLVRVFVDLEAKFMDAESAQNLIEAELVGTTYKVRRRLMGPAISLEVGLDALQIIDTSRHVKKVTEDRLIPPN